MRYLTLLLAVACVHAPVELPKLDDRILHAHINQPEQAEPTPEPYVGGYSGGGLISPVRGSVAKTILGSGAISLSAAPTYAPNGMCWVTSLPCTQNNGQIIASYVAGVWSMYVGGAVRFSISNGTGAVAFATSSLTINTDLFVANTTQVLVRSNSLAQFSVGTAGVAWLDVQSTGVALGLATSVTGTLQSTGVVMSTNAGNAIRASAVGGQWVNGSNLYAQNTAPTISSGFGTSPSVTTSNGTFAFTINVGTGGVATSGVIGLPTTTNGWVCSCDDLTQVSTSPNKTIMTAQSTSSCTVTNKVMSTGAAAAWAASDILHCSATGR